MVTIAEYSRLVSQIHSSALAADHWGEAMALLGRTAGAAGGALIVNDGGTREVKNASIDPEAQRSYVAHYHRFDYVLEAVEKGPVGVIREGPPLMALNSHSEFNTDWMRRHHFSDGLFVRLTAGPEPSCFLVAAAASDQSFATSERVELVNALIPHIQQALRAESHLADLRRGAADIDCAINTMRHPTFVVGPGAQVVHLNSAATELLARGGDVFIAGGSLSAASRRVVAELQRGVAASLGLTDDGARSGSSLRCPATSGGRGYVVHISPFTSPGCSPLRALVVVVDIDREPRTSDLLLRSLFGLTSAESDVALRAAHGRGLAAIAEDLSLSVATVKSHLQHIFDKTGTHRQAELVRLLSAIEP